MSFKKILITFAGAALLAAPLSAQNKIASKPGLENKVAAETKKTQEVSKECIELIKKAEGFSPKPYIDIDHPAIGYGHRLTEGETYTSITEQFAENLLRRDIENRYSPIIARNVKVSLTQGQYDALRSFVYNLGERRLKNSTLLKKLNNGDYIGAAEEFPKWNKSEGKVSAGLTIRREKEKALFLSENK